MIVLRSGFDEIVVACAVSHHPLSRTLGLLAPAQTQEKKEVSL